MASHGARSFYAVKYLVQVLDLGAIMVIIQKTVIIFSGSYDVAELQAQVTHYGVHMCQLFFYA
jgi:hypothetical protein